MELPILPIHHVRIPSEFRKRFGGLFKSRFEHKPNETLAHQGRNLSTGRVALYGWTNGNVESGSNNPEGRGRQTEASINPGRRLNRREFLP